jgi:hypothetical protein
MKQLNHIDTRYVVAIDIETVRLNNKFPNTPELFQNSWEYKNKQNGEIPDQEDLEDLWIKQASLYAEFSKICAVSLSFLDKTGEKLVCQGIASTNEYGLLVELANVLNRMGKSPQYRLIGHTSFYFDFPFLCKRYIINGLDIPKILDETNSKPWEKMNLDTNVIWKCGGTGPGSSLQALCVVLDVPISKVDMVGDEVGKEYFKGNIEGIRDYCNKDSIATFNVLRRFKGESIFGYEEVVYMNVSDEVEEVEYEEPTPLELLRDTGVLSDEVKNGLSQIINPENVSDEDITNLKKIIVAHYLIKSDKVSDKKRKHQEIDEFMNSLIAVTQD